MGTSECKTVKGRKPKGRLYIKGRLSKDETDRETQRPDVLSQKGMEVVGRWVRKVEGDYREKERKKERKKERWRVIIGVRVAQYKVEGIQLRKGFELEGLSSAVQG